MPFCIRIFATAGLCGLVLGFAGAWAQDRPPVASPTITVGVSALPVVRSESQGMEDFTAGLMQGLLPAYDIQGMALVVVEGGRIMLQRHYGVASAPGAPVDGNTVFAVGDLSHVLASIAAIQLIEQARLRANDDGFIVLGDDDLRGVTVTDLLSHQDDAPPDTLMRMIEEVSGRPLDINARTRILVPLGMTGSDFAQGELHTTPSDMARLMLALLNGGAFEESRILLPASVEAMFRTQVAGPPELPGWTLGFAEMRRGGRRALQHDGRSRTAEARLVLMPEDDRGYFAAVAGNAPAEFWRVLDDALTGRLLPAQDAQAAPPSGNGMATAPTARDANEVAGLYRARGGARTRAVFLKSAADALLVSARNDGALLLSGAESAVLLPRPGLYWAAADGFAAAMVDGGFVAGNRVYAPVRPWERPAPYLLIAMTTGLGALAMLLRPGWIPVAAGVTARARQTAGYSLTAISGIALLVAVLLRTWLGA